MSDVVTIYEPQITVTVNEITQAITVNEIVIQVAVTSSTIIGAKGDKGDQGNPGPAGPQNLFIQDTQPVYVGAMLWIQTGLPNNGFTLWFEDGVTV